MMKTPKIERKTNLSTIAVSALVGGLAGFTAGLLLAPKSGRKSSQVTQSNAADTFGQAEDVTYQNAGAIKHRGADLVDKGKQLADDLQTFLQESWRNKKTDYISLNIKRPPSGDIQDITAEPAEPQSDDADKDSEAAAAPETDLEK